MRTFIFKHKIIDAVLVIPAETDSDAEKKLELMCFDVDEWYGYTY